jgi:hypothetical protein
MAFYAHNVGFDAVSVHWQLLAPEIYQHLGDRWRYLPRHVLLRKHCDISCDGTKELGEVCLSNFDSRC